MQENTPTLYVEINESDYIFAVTIYDDVHNFKIVEKNIVPHDGIKNNKFINIYQTQELIKKNVQHIENKLNFIFKEVNIILGSFDCYCINVSGFKKLNGSQVLKENISYILNLFNSLWSYF